MIAKRLLLWSASVAALVVASAANADEFAVQNAMSPTGFGPIGTVDLTAGAQVGLFVPDHAKGAESGHGVLLIGNDLYYTELDGGTGPSDGLHIASWNHGAGSPDTGLIANPSPGNAIVDVKQFGGFLYLLEGFPNGPEFVDKIDLSGNLLSSVTLHTLSGGELTNSDGFTVLANGNFLINEAGTLPAYDQYDPITGNEIAGTMLDPSGCYATSGVDTDGKNLFFSCTFQSGILETDFSGNQLNFFNDVGVPSGGGWEDISVANVAATVPEPMTAGLVAGGLVFGAFSRRRRSNT